MQVRVEYDERYWYPDDGGVVWIAGYQVVDRETGRYLARDAPELLEQGCTWRAWPAPERTMPTRSRRTRVAPGGALELRRDADNAHDPERDPGPPERRRRAGRLGAPRARRGARAGAGRRPAWSAVVLREQRRSPRDPRHGLTMLLAPADRIALEIV